MFSEAMCISSRQAAKMRHAGSVNDQHRNTMTLLTLLNKHRQLLTVVCKNLILLLVIPFLKLMLVSSPFKCNVRYSKFFLVFGTFFSKFEKNNF